MNSCEKLSTNLPEEPKRPLPLSQGKIAYVSPQDYREAIKRKWSTVKKKGGGFYAEANMVIDGKLTRFLLHRFLMKAPKGVEVDHKNGDGLDCRQCNMRFATDAQSARNTKSHKDAVSKFKGVSWNSKVKQWVAQIRMHGKNTYLGKFDSEAEAAEAYDLAAVNLFEEFAHLNFPEKLSQYQATKWELVKQKPKHGRTDTPYVGIRPRGNGWVAEVGGCKLKYLGVYPNQESAAMAYDIVAVWNRGERTKINFPSRLQSYKACISRINFDSATAEEAKRLLHAEVKHLPEETARGTQEEN